METGMAKSEGALPAEARLRVDAACDRFEAACRAGQQPRIEDYLGDAGDDVRSVLQHQLILLDKDYRRRLGENPRPEGYPLPGIAAPPAEAATTLPDGDGHTSVDADLPATGGRYTVPE